MKMKAQPKKNRVARWFDKFADDHESFVDFLLFTIVAGFFFSILSFACLVTTTIQGFGFDTALLNFIGAFIMGEVLYWIFASWQNNWSRLENIIFNKVMYFAVAMGLVCWGRVVEFSISTMTIDIATLLGKITIVIVSIAVWLWFNGLKFKGVGK